MNSHAQQVNSGESIQERVGRIEAQTPLLTFLVRETITNAYLAQRESINRSFAGNTGAIDPRKLILEQQNLEVMQNRIEQAHTNGQIALSEEEQTTISNLEGWLFLLQRLRDPQAQDRNLAVMEQLFATCKAMPGQSSRLLKTEFCKAYASILTETIKTNHFSPKEKVDSILIRVNPELINALCHDHKIELTQQNLILLAMLVKQVKEAFLNTEGFAMQEGQLYNFTASLISEALNGRIEMPSPSEVKQLATLIREDLIDNRETHVLSPICPDYHTSKDQQTGMHRFTMRGVGDSIGLVGQTILNTGVPLLKHLHNINALQWQPGYAGLEATEENLILNHIPGAGHSQRVEQFLQLLNGSAQRLQEAILLQHGSNINVGIYPWDVRFVESDREITLEQFDKLRETLREFSDFTIVREGMGEMQNVSTGVDWIVMGLIASSRRSLIVDGASSVMGRRFYEIARKLANAIDIVQRKNDPKSISPNDIKQIAEALGKSKGSYSSEQIVNLVDTIRGILGENVRFSPLPVIYLKTNYAGY